MTASFQLTIAVLFLTSQIPTGKINASTGDQQIVLPAGHYGLNYFPDEPISILNTNPFRFLLVADGTYLMEGQSLGTSIPRRKVLAPGPKNSFDNGYAGITSTHFDKKKNVLLGFYHAEDHVGMPKVSYNKDINGAYWSVGLAVSRDNGNSFQKAGQILRASVSKNQVTHEIQGLGDVCVLPDATGKYLYAYYTDLSRRKNDQTARIGLARCSISDLGKPGTWFNYYNGDFTEKGLGGNQTAVLNPPTSFPSEIIAPHVTYLAEWRKYLMVCNVVSFTDCEKQAAEKGGIFLSFSDDGINWKDPSPLSIGLPIPYQGKEYMAHPRLIIDKIDSKQAKGYLLYCYSPRWGTTPPLQPHHLAQKAITLNLEIKRDSFLLNNALKGTKWTNSNNVPFEWTTDGRFLHKGIEREWSALDGQRILIVFGPDHKDELIFNESLTEFKQLIRGGPESFIGKKQKR